MGNIFKVAEVVDMGIEKEKSWKGKRSEFRRLLD